MCTFIDKSKDFFTKTLFFFFNSKEIRGSWCRIESAPTVEKRYLNHINLKKTKKKNKTNL